MAIMSTASQQVQSMQYLLQRRQSNLQRHQSNLQRLRNQQSIPQWQRL
jgi:hypothetical protein